MLSLMRDYEDLCMETLEYKVRYLLFICIISLFSFPRNKVGTKYDINLQDWKVAFWRFQSEVTKIHELTILFYTLKFFLEIRLCDPNIFPARQNERHLPVRFLLFYHILVVISCFQLVLKIIYCAHDKLPIVECWI